MAFTTALSGLNAASSSLQVTGNNIANSNTTGFKESRAEFADVYAANFGSASSNRPGSGVRVADVAQQFTQGNLEFTENNLDLAISGEGFFILGDTPANVFDQTYTRSGEFKLDRDGFIVNNQGRPLLAYRPNGTTVAEGFAQGVLQTVQLTSLQGQPVATTSVTEQVNLDSSSPDLTTQTFDPTVSTTYTNQTSATVFDSLGDSHVLTTYYVAGPVAGANRTWEAYHYLDGVGVNVTGNTLPTGSGVIGQTLTFNSVGQLIGPVVGGVVGQVPLVSTAIPGSPANPLVINMDYASSTQLSLPFSVENLTQDGLPAGRLTGVDVSDDGIIFARFSNGGSRPLGQVAMAQFNNQQGLTKVGDTAWAESADSGQPRLGEAGTNNFGLIQSGALESSNVDLAEQLVKLIIAQQTYQANAETISTEDAITQTILNI